MTAEAHNTATDAGEIRLRDLLAVWLRYKRRIALVGAVAVVLSAAIAWVLPNSYVATTRILPPQQGNSGAAAMLAQLGALGSAMGAGGMSALKNPNDLYVAMLKSRTVGDALIDRFDLLRVFEASTRTDARLALWGRTQVVAGRDGLITLEFEHTDPRTAAKIANGFVEELYRLTQTLAVSEASQRRLFYEQQLRSARDKLAAAEQALKEQQQLTGVLMPSEQSRASLETVARVRGLIAAKELQIQSMRLFATDQNPDLQWALQELSGLRTQLARLQQSAPGDVLVPTAKIPEEGLEYARRLREVKYAEVIVEVLSRQYELARLDEGKNAALIQVLDTAVPPERHAKPKRALIVVVTTVFALMLAAASAWWSAAREGMLRASK